ncbi:MAG TPA: hypothetical protein ENK96_10365, partial [Desulfobulbaceae bacterium]|nr:hypothetical protein [Desulfobulbaceae bacterium]
MRLLIFFCILSFFTFLSFVSPVPAAGLQSPSHQALADILNSQPTISLGMMTVGIDPDAVDKTLVSLYDENDMQPLWLENNQPGSRAHDLLRTLQHSDLDGLNPDDYKVAEILTLWHQNDETSRARLDVLLTLVLGRYVADMREGSADPCLLDPKLFAAARDQEVDILQVVNGALYTDNISAYLQNQAPAHFPYQGLRKELAHFRRLSRLGGWDTIPGGKTIKPNMSDPRLPLIVHRLKITGELQDSTTYFQRYEPVLVEAVKKFQRHFLLEPDGIIGKKTLTALNIPVDELVRKIILNMERWRWLPHRLDGKRIFVNIAGFRLFGATDEQMEITMPVIVGRVYHKTPVFTGSLRYVEVNPYWNVPDSIAVKEIVPSMQKDPNYLKNHSIRIFKGWAEDAPEIDPTNINWKIIGKKIKRYRLRQDPGPENSLGRIKFIFPNTNNIYLHVTPARQLFKRTIRSFSHGCIRVGKPLDLGVYVLKENKKPLDIDQLRKIIAGKKRKIILLDKR